jgi:hypothetical protein
MVGWEKSLGVKAALCAAFTLIAPFPAVALDVDQCSDASDIMAPHQAEGDYEDLRNSLIAYQGGGCVDGGCWSFVSFVNCRSGETLDVDVQTSTRRDVALGMIRDAVASTTRYTFADVQGLLVEAGFESDLTTADREVCACKALYPNDRRGKTPYVFESIYEDVPTTIGDDE